MSINQKDANKQNNRKCQRKTRKRLKYKHSSSSTIPLCVVTCASKTASHFTSAELTLLSRVIWQVLGGGYWRRSCLPVTFHISTVTEVTPGCPERPALSALTQSNARSAEEVAGEARLGGALAHKEGRPRRPRRAPEPRPSFTRRSPLQQPHLFGVS